MNEVIYKYPLPVEDLPTVEMPTGAQVLCVQVQEDKPFLWAIVDPGQPLERRWFRLCGTGQLLGINLPTSRYIGTFQLQEGTFIGHVFELVKQQSD